MAAAVTQELRAGPGPSSMRMALLHGSHMQRCRTPCCAHRTRHSPQLAARLQHSPAAWQPPQRVQAGSATVCCAAAPARRAGAMDTSCVASCCLSSSIPQQQWPQQQGRRESPGSSRPGGRAAAQPCPSSPSTSSLCGWGGAAAAWPSIGSRAGRLPPAGASLALVEPTTAAGAAAAAAAVGGGKAGTAAALATGSFSLSKVLAVVIGYCVMVGSLFRSVPQIVKVLQHNSTEGLSLTSYLVELCCYSVVIAYNMCQGYGFNTFGEVVACWVQDVILIALVFRDRRTSPWVVAATAAGIGAGCALLLSPACPPALLAGMQASNIAVMALGSRLPQILLNMRRGNAGMLSVTTCVLNVAGNAARVFTTLVLTGDLLMLGGACSQGCLNTILLCQSVSTARARSRAAKAAALGGSDSSSSGTTTTKQPLLQRKEPEPEPPSGGFPALQPAA